MKVSLSEVIILELVKMVSIVLLPLQALAWLDLLFGWHTLDPASVRATSCLSLAACGYFGWRFLARTKAVGLAARASPALYFLAGTYILFLINMLVSYPDGFDAVEYHLMVPLEWLQRDGVRLHNSEPLFAQPANAELLALPALAMNLQGLVTLGNCFASGVLGLSVYALAARVSGNKEAGVFSLILILSVPIIVFQTFVLYTDMFGTAFLFAGIALFASYVQGNSDLRLLAGSAMACGVSLGTKPFCWAYCGIFFAVVAILLGLKNGFHLAGMFATIMLAPALIWFVRNTVATGNPFYPVGMNLGPVTLPGFARAAMVHGPKNSFHGLPIRTLIYPWREYSRDASAPLSVDRGFGPAFAAFWVPSLLATCTAAIRRKQAPVLILLGGFAVSLIVWSAALFRVLRFGLPVVGLLTIFPAIFYEQLSSPLRRYAHALLTVCVAAGCFMCVLAPARQLAIRARFGLWSRSAYYGYPDIIDSLPGGSRVLNRASRGTNFELAGKNLSNIVVIIPGSMSADELRRDRIDYVVKDRVPDAEDVFLKGGAGLIYSGTPVSMNPKSTPTWRVYRVSR